MIINSKLKIILNLRKLCNKDPIILKIKISIMINKTCLTNKNNHIFKFIVIPYGTTRILVNLRSMRSINLIIMPLNLSLFIKEPKTKKMRKMKIKKIQTNKDKISFLKDNKGDQY